MIKLKMSIEDISEYQTGILPKNAVKIETPQNIEEMMKKAAPIAAVLCVLMFVTMLCKTVMNKTVVISHVFILIGFCLGYICLVIHEWLHGIVYPRNALVTIGKITGKISFVALASYPLKRRRFIVMCLLPFVLGIIPLLIFIVSPAEYRELNGLMFGMSCMGMVSPFPDVYNVFIVLKNVNKKDAIGDKKLGIAEAREEAIISALENLVTFSNDQETISWKEFISLDIIGDKARRLQIYDLFHLGYGNAKTLFKRLNLARITKQDILNKLGESK